LIGNVEEWSDEDADDKGMDKTTLGGSYRDIRDAADDPFALPERRFQSKNSGGKQREYLGFRVVKSIPTQESSSGQLQN